MMTAAPSCENFSGVFDIDDDGACLFQSSPWCSTRSTDRLWRTRAWQEQYVREGLMPQNGAGAGACAGMIASAGAGGAASVNPAGASDTAEGEGDVQVEDILRE